MAIRPSLPAVVTLGAAAVVAVLFRYFWSYRDEPGGWWWLGVLASMALYGFTYGTGLLVFAPAVKWVFEAGRFAAAAMAGVTFLGFALTYTGRGHYRRSWAFRGLVVVLAGWVGLLFTTPWHGLLWSEFHTVRTLGAAAVAYTREPLLWGGAVIIWLSIGVGTALLFGTIVSYGSLYRSQALAIALTPVPVAAASYAHLAGVGPVPNLDLVPVAFLPHLALDSYALFYGGMFEMTPAARRLGERAALDDLGTPVAIVDDGERVVKLNDAAERAFGVDRRQALGRRLPELLGADLDLGGGEASATIDTPEGRREFDVITSPVEDAAGRPLGHTVGFHDVTDERRRKQRLAVLNRVLRHNLRNDVTAVQGYLDPIATGQAAEGDADPQTLARRAERNLADLVDLGTKAREIDRIVDREARPGEPVDVAALLADLAAELREEHPDCDLVVDADEGLTADADDRVLAAVVRELVENAVEHHDGERAHVEVRAERAAADGREWIRLSVVDDGPGVPDHEREVVEAGAESDLKHGSGLGLWLVKWAVAELDGDLAFGANRPRGTVVSVRLPAPSTV